MYVLDCPRVQRPREGIGLEWTPDLPEGVRFASCSSRFDATGRTMVYLPDGRPEDVDEALKLGCVLVRDADEADRAETATLVTALRTPDPRWVTDVKPLRDEKRSIIDQARAGARDLTRAEKDRVRAIIDDVSAKETDYIDKRFASASSALIAKSREAVIPLERALDLADALDVAKDIAVRLGIFAAVAFLAHSLHLPYALALTVLHTDSFNRSDRALSGDTMSDGVGVWGCPDASNPRISSNKVAGGGAWHYGYDSVMSNVDVQRTTMTWSDLLIQAGVRIQTVTGYGYYADARSGAHYLYRYDGLYNNIGSGAGLSVGDTWACDADGTTIKTLKNGSVDITATGQTDYSTGKAGLFTNAAFTTAGLADDWQVEVAGGGGGGTSSMLSLLGVG